MTVVYLRFVLGIAAASAAGSHVMVCLCTWACESVSVCLRLLVCCWLMMHLDLYSVCGRSAVGFRLLRPFLINASAVLGALWLRSFGPCPPSCFGFEASRIGLMQV